MSELITTFIFFFAVIDPIGTVPVFLEVARNVDPPMRRRIAIKATVISALILIFFVVAGEVILTALSIPVAAFRVAGGIVLFLFALTMLFGESKPEEELKLTTDAHEAAVFPLAVPSIAGPGAMLGAVLMTENNKFNVLDQVKTTGVMLSVLLVTLALMLAATAISRMIGKTGAIVISRVMGLLLASMAVASVLAGIKDYFAL